MWCEQKKKEKQGKMEKIEVHLFEYLLTKNKKILGRKAEALEAM